MGVYIVKLHSVNYDAMRQKYSMLLVTIPALRHYVGRFILLTVVTKSVFLLIVSKI